MEHLLALVFIMALIGATYSGTLVPQFVEGSGNTADGDSKITWGPLPAGEPYKTNDTLDLGGLELLYKMMKGFLKVVQPNDLPYDLLLKMIAGDTGAITSDPMKIVMYALGFAICFAVGILIVIFMPIVGCCFCCCRLCGNCGGKKIHQPKDIKNGYRIVFTVMVFVMATFIMVPAACSLAANEQTSKNLKNVGDVVTNNIDDMKTFLDNTVLQAKHVAVKNYKFAVQVIERDLDNIGIVLGEPIRDEIAKAKSLSDTFEKIVTLDKSMQSLKDTFKKADTQQDVFDAAYTTLKGPLDTERAKVVATKFVATCNSVLTCSSYATAMIDLDCNKPAVLADITPSVAKIDTAASKNLTAKFETATAAFNNIPKRVYDDTVTMRAEVKTTLNSFITTIEDAIKSIDGITNNLDFLDSTKGTIKGYTGEVGKYDKYRWYGGLGLGCMLLMIALFQYLGCVIGVCTYKSKVDPSDRSACSNSAANLLMASVGFMFIFSWLLMLLTSITFIIGGNMQRLICDPLLDPTYKVFHELIDKPGALGEGYFLGGMLLQDKTVNVTISGILDGCKNNQSAWNVLKLDHLINLNQLTDYKSKIDLESELNKNNIDLTGITIPTTDLNAALDDFKLALSIDYTVMITELKKPTVKKNLNDIAIELNQQAALTASSAAQTQLTDEATAIKNIHTTQFPPADTARVKFLALVTTIQNDKVKVEADIAAVKTALAALETYLQNSAGTIINTQVEVFLLRILSVMDSFVKKALTGIENEMGICTPLWNLYNSIIGDVFCKTLVGTLNGFWFCLGWATFTFLPAIIFSVKLNKYLRKCRPIEPDFNKKAKASKKKKKGLKYVRAETPTFRNRVGPQQEN